MTSVSHLAPDGFEATLNKSQPCPLPGGDVLDEQEAPTWRARAQPVFRHHAGEIGESLFVVGQLLVPPVATSESPCENALAQCEVSDPVHAVSLSTLGTTSQPLASDSDSSFTGWRTSLRRHKRVHLVEAGTISVQRGREKVAYAPHLRTPGKHLDCVLRWFGAGEV
jgi:hypothetical protein